MKKLIHLAWPVFVSQAAIMLNGLIDTLMAGRLSALDLAAIGVGSAIFGSVFVTMLGVLLALTPIVAQHFGAGRHQEIGEEVRQAVWIALALALPVVFLLRHPDPLLAIARLTPAMDEKVRAYLSAMTLTVPAAMGLRLFSSFSAGIGRPRPVMMLNLAALLLKAPFNALFMYGGLGLPAFGAAGCGIASALCTWIACLLAWLWCARWDEYREFALFARWSWPDRQRLVEQLKLGLPVGATFLVDITAFTFMALFIARLGPIASGAHQIAANLAVLCFMLPTSVGYAAGVLSAQAIGARNFAEARRVGFRGFRLGLGCAAATAALLATTHGALARFYTPDVQVQALAARLILLVAVYHLTDGLQTVAVNLLRGYKRATVPMAIYAVALWGIGLPTGIALGLGDGLGPALGPQGFWISASGALTLAGVLVTAYWWRISARAVSRNHA